MAPAPASVPAAAPIADPAEAARLIARLTEAMTSLLDVPKEQIEAAQIDGAGPVKRFRYVTLPAIQPVLLFTIVTGVIYTMQYYTQAIVAGEVASGHVATAGTTLDIGYPLGSSLTVPQLIYEQGILNANTGPACMNSATTL